MKLPEIKSGSVRELQGAPSISQGMAAGQMVQQVGKQISDTALGWHKALADEKHRQNVHNARVAKFEMDEEIAFTTQAMAAEQYMDADDPLLAGVKGYTTRANGKVLTSEVAPLIMASRMEDMVKRYGDSITDGRTKDSWVADQRASVSRVVGQLAQRASQIAQQDRFEESERMYKSLVEDQNYEGARTQIQAGLMNGEYDETQAEERLRLIGNAQEVTTNTEAINDRNLKAINSRIKEMGKSQEEYGGHLKDENKRLSEKQRLERARDALTAGNKAAQDFAKIFAQHEIDRAVSAHQAGGDPDGSQLALAWEKHGAAATAGETSKSDFRWQLKHRDYSAVIEHTGNMATMNLEERELYMVDQRGKTSTYFGDLQEQVNNVNDRLRTDPATYYEQVGALPKAQFDFTDVVTSTQRESQQMATAQQMAGTSDDPKVFRPAVVEAFRQVYNSSGIAERASLVQQISEGLGHDPTQMERLLVQANFDNGEHLQYAALAASRGHVDVIADQARGAQLRNDPSSMAEMKSKNLNDAALNVTLSKQMETLGEHYSLTAGGRFEALKDVVVARVLDQGMDAKAAARRALQQMLPGPVVSQSGGVGPDGMGAGAKKIVTPEPDMSGKTWRHKQTGVGDDYYRSVGYVGTPSLRQMVIDGDAFYKNTELGPYKFHVYTDDDVPVIGGNGKRIVVDLSDAGANMNTIDDERRELERNRISLEAATARSERVRAREERIQRSREARGRE